MFVLWGITYLDRSDRQFKRRDLVLDTATLAPAQRGAVELVLESDNERAILRLRTLFQDRNPDESLDRCIETGFKTFCLTEYFEDENGVELSRQEMGQIVSGSPTAVMLPCGTEQHHIDFIFSEPIPLPIDEVLLADEQIELLGYFSRDYGELFASAFMDEKPGTLSSGGVTAPILTTAVSAEEISSAVTVFRRLYMADDPANFGKAVEVYKAVLGNHPRANWVFSQRECYLSALEKAPWMVPFVPGGHVTFTRKRLIDVFLYTLYAHQPDARRQRQFAECLAEVKGQRSFLDWLFLTELWSACLAMKSAGKQIVHWFNRYCEHHQITPEVLTSILDNNPGLGTQEKKDAKEARLLQEKVEAVATELWRGEGCPAGGPEQFRAAALSELQAVLGR